MKHLLILFLTLFTTTSHAWTITADFENGVVGETAEAPTDAFHDSAGRSKYADTPALSGTQSASVLATEGETGFGVWGGGFTYPTPLGEGDQVWFRVNAYYPAGWDFSCGGCTEGMKFMRVHTRKALGTTSGINEGYHTLLIRSDSLDGSGGLLKVSTEVNPNQFIFTPSAGTEVPRDEWVTYEMYIKFSSVPGEAIYRVWQNGTLIYENLNFPTLVSPTSISNRIFLYTFWNNGAPRTQTSFVDDIVITSDIPGRTDAAGNPFIGVGPSIFVAKPGKPTSIMEQP